MNFSKSPLTGNKYSIPKNLDDQIKIDSFVERNKESGRKIVAVQGLGFVGAAMSVVVANSSNNEYATIGVDLATPESYWKIASINEGTMPIKSSDDKIFDFFNNTQAQDNFLATHDPHAYSVADIIIVDINLDVEKKLDDKHDLDSYKLSLDGFKKGISTIAKNCKDDVLIVVETTVPPGTCEKVVKPILDDEFKKRGLENNYKLAHSYERVMPGPDYIDSIINFYRVYSGINKESADTAETFLRSIIKTDEFPLTRLHSTTATEMAKVLENSYRAMNIAFMQEWTEFAESAGVNLYEVIDAIRMRPTHKNIMRPGLGVGGYCLTKDPLLASWARKELFDGKSLPESERAVRINDQMPLHTLRLIADEINHQNNTTRILILGISYRGDVGDTRYTPVDLLYKQLVSMQCDLTLHDPYVSYWEEQDKIVETDLSRVLTQSYDIVILATAHSEYTNNDLLTNWIANNKSLLVVDANRVLSNNQLKEIQVNNKLKVLGRGDI